MRQKKLVSVIALCIHVLLQWSVPLEYNLACTEDVPTCGDTCDKVPLLFPVLIQPEPLVLVLQLLLCGVHRCTRLCHAGGCGQCLQMAEKVCRCGKKTKLVPCSQEFLCESRCSNLRQCGKHQCKRKVPAGLITSLHLSSVPACALFSAVMVIARPVSSSVENLLDVGTTNVLLPAILVRTSFLAIKVFSSCYHYSGPCYPCVLTADVSCFCGATKVTVLCGKQKSTKPPRCRELCTLPSACHHPRRQAHSCHFGVCPRCSLPCSLPLPCGHLCSQRCHSEPRPPARKQGQAPWMKVNPAEKVVDPCPPCMQLVQRYIL